MSDNGFLFGEHRINQTKIPLYEESIRIPLIIHHPDFPGQRSISKMVAMVDIAPTIVEIAGAKPNLAMDGRSLIPLMQNPSTSWRNFLLLEADHRETGNNIKYVAIRSTSEVYAEHLLTGEKEFYRLSGGTTTCGAADPYQLTSQHNNQCYAPRRQSLKAKLNVLKSCAGSGCRSAER